MTDLFADLREAPPDKGLFDDLKGKPGGLFDDLQAAAPSVPAPSVAPADVEEPLPPPSGNFAQDLWSLLKRGVAATPLGKAARAGRQLKSSLEPTQRSLEAAAEHAVVPGRPVETVVRSAAPVLAGSFLKLSRELSSFSLKDRANLKRSFGFMGGNFALTLDY